MGGPGKIGPTRLAGFTLVEIMLVMMILSILTAAVLTNLHAGYQDLALESDTKLLTETIEAAQQYSRNTRQICRLVLDPDHGEYYLLQAAAMDQTWKPALNFADLYSLDRSIHFKEIHKLGVNTTDHEQINFYPDGVADAANILLVSDGGEERMIEIGSLAGPPTVTTQ